MVSSRQDRLIGLWMSAALVVAWGVVYDLAGNSFAIRVAALGLAIWSVAGWPGFSWRLAGRRPAWPSWPRRRTSNSTAAAASEDRDATIFKPENGQRTCFPTYCPFTWPWWRIGAPAHDK